MATSSNNISDSRQNSSPELSNPQKKSSIAKKQPSDFIFGKVLGEGSYSTVILAKEVATSKEFAVKVLEKRHIIQEKKNEYVMREKEVLSRIKHPFFIKLYCTFQDIDRLYFVLSYAQGGELLTYINKLGCFDEKCTQFYSAEIVLALEYLQSINIIHRDLKPENILLDEKMHIQIADFGSAKIVDNQPTETDDSNNSGNKFHKRRKSFVGTAQYVSPEVLTSKSAHFSSDLWSLGCIVFQLLSGQFPFWGSHEYEIFQKITKLEFKIPDGFNSDTKDLINKLLVLDPDARLGCSALGGYQSLKSHKFFDGICWESLPESDAPVLLPYLPAKDKDSTGLWSEEMLPGFDNRQCTELLMKNLQLKDSNKGISKEEHQQKLKLQNNENPYHKFVENNLIIKQGLIDKRKGFSEKRRMLLLTEGPHLYYVDPQAMVLKGEIPWSRDLKPEAKNFKIFFVHTPNRTYYLEDPQGNSLKWCEQINKVWQRYYGKLSTDKTNS